MIQSHLVPLSLFLLLLLWSKVNCCERFRRRLLLVVLRIANSSRCNVVHHPLPIFRRVSAGFVSVFCCNCRSLGQNWTVSVKMTFWAIMTSWQPHFFLVLCSISASVFCGHSCLASRYFFCWEIAVDSFSPCLREYQETLNPFSTVWLAYLFRKSALNFSHGWLKDLEGLHHFVASSSKDLPTVLVQCWDSVPDCSNYDSHSWMNASGSTWLRTGNSGSSGAGAFRALMLCRRSWMEIAEEMNRRLSWLRIVFVVLLSWMVAVLAAKFPFCSALSRSSVNKLVDAISADLISSWFPD